MRRDVHAEQILRDCDDDCEDLWRRGQGLSSSTCEFSHASIVCSAAADRLCRNDAATSHKKRYLENCTRLNVQNQPTRTHDPSRCSGPVGGTRKRWLAEEVDGPDPQYCRPGGPAIANHLTRHDAHDHVSRRLDASDAGNQSLRTSNVQRSLGRCPVPVLGSVPLRLTRRPSLKELERAARGQKKKQEQKQTGPGPEKSTPKKNRRNQPGQGDETQEQTRGGQDRAKEKHENETRKRNPHRKSEHQARNTFHLRGCRFLGRRPSPGSGVGALATRPQRWSKTAVFGSQLKARPQRRSSEA